MERTLIKCGWLVTLDPVLGDMRNAEILVQGNRIQAIGRKLDAAAEHVIDASDKVVMPGLINAHMHTWQTGMRGLASEWTSAIYHRIFHARLGPHYTAEDNYIATLVGALAQIDGGTTTLVDWCHDITGMEHAERSIDGLCESGIRAVFAHGTAKPSTAPGGVPYSEMPHPRDRIEKLLKSSLSDRDGRVTLAMAILGPDYSTYEVTRKDILLAREFGLVASYHTRLKAESVTPDGYDRMLAEGLLGPDNNVVHAFNFGDALLRRIVESGASVTSVTLNEMHHQVPEPAIVRVRAFGGMPSLGIDNECFVSGSMWRELQNALLLVRFSECGTNARLGNPQLEALPARSREALEWATIGGARAFHLDRQIGSLFPGKKADIIMLRANDLNLFPIHDPVMSVVEQAHGGNVDTVMVDGILRKKNGVLLFPATLLAQKRAELTRSALRILENGGYRGVGDTAPAALAPA